MLFHFVLREVKKIRKGTVPLKGVIREALIELEHHGFLHRTPFAGTQVTELTLLDAQQVFNIRIELESLAFFLAGPSVNA